MVALGNKDNYVKDAAIHAAVVLWLIWSSSVLFVQTGKIADMIDEPIRCGVPSHGDLSSRQLMIRERCDVVDGEYYIPRDAWTGERTWLDFYIVTSWLWFVVFSLCYFVGSMGWYFAIFSAENAEQRHAKQTALDHGRSLYMLAVTGLSFNFFLVYAVVLNKLTAFGAWDGISATEVFDSRLDSATVIAQDQESWDMESFLPDLSDVFSFSEPDSDHEQYVGAYIHNFVVHCGMSFLKNAFIAIIALMTDDWHIVSLAIASIPTVLVITLFYVPYMASFYFFKLVGLHFYLQFDFEFNHELKTCVFGGILFGTAGLPVCFEVWISWSMKLAARLYDVYIDVLKQKEEEPNCCDLSYLKILAYQLSDYSVLGLGLLSFYGIIGLPCLGYCMNVVGTDNVVATFNFILTMWILNWCIAAAFSLARCCMGETSGPSLGHGVTYDEVLEVVKQAMESENV